MEHIKETLHELHEALAAGQEVDAETQALLKELGADINQLLEKSETTEDGTPLVDSAEKDSLMDQMLDLTEQFEESHPRLAQVIGRIASALSSIGI